MNPKKINVAVIGCGLIGNRRAAEASTHQKTQLRLVSDVVEEKCSALKKAYGCVSTRVWQNVIDDPSIDVVIVATPNGYTAEIGIAALQAGKHVLVEKPPGRDVDEATRLFHEAKKSKKLLKVGFNHRYHPAIHKAYCLLKEGLIGNIINLRARYGHGGRPGYEKEWRGNSQLAGGGELTDQGVHIADLIHWFAGFPSQAFAQLQTAVWPIKPLEDNAFGLFTYPNGIVTSFHTSWTQWKNLFSFEIFGEKGSLVISGLGGSYGVETLYIAVRKAEGGVPQMVEEKFEGPDLSWKLEWDQFVTAILEGTPYWGIPEDGIAAMRMIAALYRSAKTSLISEI